LRAWLGLDRETFYDASRLAILPMGFCFPGLDERKADLPPRRECASQWHAQIFALLPRIETILITGSHARAWHFSRFGLEQRLREPLTQTVRDWRLFAAMRPALYPLPHPSWRNSHWLKRNPWFESEVVPALKAEVARAMNRQATD